MISLRSTLVSVIKTECVPNFLNRNIEFFHASSIKSMVIFRNWQLAAHTLKSSKNLCT
jgi:hypothetical protein